jgi:hypothetical protein
MAENLTFFMCRLYSGSLNFPELSGIDKTLTQRQMESGTEVMAFRLLLRALSVAHYVH